MKKKWLSALLAAVLLLAAMPAAMAAEDSYTDEHGHTVTVPEGGFAARVLSFEAGSPWTGDRAGQAQENILGSPAENSEALCLGYGGSVVLEFDANIYDGPGDDIHIFENGGSSMEPVYAAVSSDLNTWHSLGTVGGKTSGVDLNGKVPAGSSFRYICLVDAKSSTSGWPGADVNAVAGLHIQALTAAQQSAGASAFRGHAYIDRDGVLRVAPENAHVYVDRKGNHFMVPENAFAARVVSFEAGTPWTKDSSHMDPQSVLGPCDYQEPSLDSSIGALTLGCSGVLILEYRAGIYDGPGDDIYVFEVGPDAEATKVEVSSDLVTWYDVGTAAGSTSGLDLNGKVPAESWFRYVRLTDCKKSDGGSWPGADIDAVAALNVRTVSSTWARTEVERAEDLGLVPDILKNAVMTQPITRLEFAAVAVKVYENLAATQALPATVNPFTDCADTEMLKAYNVGITDGTSATTFSPDDLLNREQAATMLTRVFKRATIPGWSLSADSSFPLTYTMPAPFADDADVSGWARDSVYFMAANQLINGNEHSQFMPRNTTSAQEAAGYANATREQALAIAVRMVENLK